MVWDWIYRIIAWRQIRDDIREMDEMARRWEWMQRDMDRRIAELYTPEEWKAVGERCEAKLRNAYRL